MSSTILLCTVGGSHQPILKSIEANEPDYTCFFCTERDPVTDKPGSITQVTGTGNVISKRWGEKPTLPNIPTQAGLDADSFDAKPVPADDLDRACVAMRTSAAHLAARFPGARFIADYTGGTKTMTAALVYTALDRDDVELKLVTGSRPDLVAVQDGTEQAMRATTERLRIDLAMARSLRAWQRYAYSEAAAGLDAIRIAVDAPDRVRLAMGRILSQALAHWDNFDHAAALALLDDHAGRIMPELPSLLPDLRLLTGNDARREPARLWDLWLNAERRAAQGRFDDAVARWYRLMEWTAQWQLKIGLDVDTADFPGELLPPGMDARPGRKGKVELGLWKAWQTAAHRLPGPVADFFADEESRLFNLLKTRNHSILAHGFDPVLQADWEQVRTWTQTACLPLLRCLAGQAGLKKPLKQLPQEPPSFVREVV